MNEEDLISVVDPDLNDARIQAAITELRALIAAHYPAAVFSVAEGDDPEGVYLRAIVDVADLDAVTEVFIDRLVDFQEEGLPVFVAVGWPAARVREQLRHRMTDQVPIEQLLPIG